jgi:hypothetical protein
VSVVSALAGDVLDVLDGAVDDVVDGGVLVDVEVLVEVLVGVITTSSPVVPAETEVAPART